MWTSPGQPSVAGAQLDAALTARGQRWRVQPAAEDGTPDPDGPFDEVEIGNQGPMLTATLSPTTGHLLTTFTVTAAASDADDDPLQVTVQWEGPDGAVLSTGPSFVPSVLDPGDPLLARVTAEDGQGGQTEATVQVELQAVPGDLSITLTPDTPDRWTDLTCEVDGASPGVPGGATYRWTEAERGEVIEDAVVDRSRLLPGQRWTCDVTWPGGQALSASATIADVAPGGNVLLVLLDDVGVDKIGAYGWHPSPPPTPTFDALAAEGVLFDQAYAYTACSPTRAAVLTGRYGRRTGIGRTVVADDDVDGGLSPDEVGLPEALALADTPYAAAMIGKWHLTGLVPADALQHPAAFGFSRWVGTVSNPLLSDGTEPLTTSSYYSWQRWDQDRLVDGSGYLTSVTVDDALQAIDTLPEPWLVWLAFNAPHTPLHWPPPELHTRTDAELQTSSGIYDAMLEAADTELGRLLDTLPPDVRARTTIVVMGDNGTSTQGTTAPWDPDRAKGTLFEGGVRVPLVVSGRAAPIRGVRTEAMVHAVDVFATVLDVAGVDPAPLYGDEGGPGLLAPWPLDGVSFLPSLLDPSAPARSEVYLERFAPNGVPSTEVRGFDVGLRDARYKLLVASSGQVELLDLSSEAGRDGVDLLADGMSADEEAIATRLFDRLFELGTFLDESERAARAP